MLYKVNSGQSLDLKVSKLQFIPHITHLMCLYIAQRHRRVLNNSHAARFGLRFFPFCAELFPSFVFVYSQCFHHRDLSLSFHFCSLAASLPLYLSVNFLFLLPFASYGLFPWASFVKKTGWNFFLIYGRDTKAKSFFLTSSSAQMTSGDNFISHNSWQGCVG